MSGYPGKQGRKPKPATIIDNLRKQNESGGKMPACPEWLPLEAKRIWKREARALFNAGLLSFVDGPAFAGYCLLRAQLMQAQKELGTFSLTHEYTNKNGSTNEIARPQVAIIHKCLEQIKSYAAEFGMTPASRSRIPSLKKDGPAKHEVNQVNQAKITPVSEDPRAFLQEMSK